MSIKVQLNHGKLGIVDDADRDLISQYHWTAVPNHHGNWYMARWISVDGKRKILFFHRLLLNAKAGSQVDHIDGNGLNNCRNNLRLCTHADNCRNSKLRKSNTSGYKGVHKSRAKWVAQIAVDGKAHHLGSYVDILDAARSYDHAARIIYGEFAKTNF